MPTYIMFGKYSLESIKEISAERTKNALGVIEENNGSFKSGFALLGETDLVLITDFPGIEQVMKASVELTKLLGISFSTAPAISVEDLDKLLG